MKKALSLLLALVMALALTAPALAAETDDLLLISPAPDEALIQDLDPAAEWAKTCEEYPEETALFLAEFDTWFAEESYGLTFETYCTLRDYTPEQAYSALFHSWLRDYEWKQEQERTRIRFITAHGGVPGQFNLMVNGKFLTFPAERPLYQTSGVTYVDAAVLSKALGTEVTADERGYAAVRPAAEAAGYLCLWDREYNAGVLISPDVMAAEIDKQFTVFNRLLAQSAYTGGNQRTMGSVKGGLTLFDSLNGDKTAKLSGSYDMTASEIGFSGTASYDLSALWALFEDYIPAPLDMDYYPEDYAQEYAQMMDLVKSLMKGKTEVRFDLENQTVYFSMPVLFQAMNSLLTESGIQLPDNGWLSLSLDDADLDLDSIRPTSTPTLGSMLCANFSALFSLPSDTVDLGYGSAEFYDSVMEYTDTYATFFGDKKFTRKGNADVLTLTLEDLNALYEDDYTYQSLPFSQFEFTLKVKDNGDTELDLSCRMSSNNISSSLGDIAVITAHSTVKGGKTEFKTEVHVKNVLKLSLTTQETRTQTSRIPQVTPPKGTMILDLSSLDALGA